MNVYSRYRAVRRLLSTAAAGLLSTGLGTSALAGNVPEYCGTSGLTEEQLKKCDETAKDVGAERIGDIELIKTRFPFRQDLLGLSNEYNIKKPIEVNIHSKDGTYLRIQYRNSSPFILIPRERIVRWSTGSENSVDASGAIGATLGAVFFPPMLLAAPFGIGNVKTHQYQIQYIDEQAEPRTAILSATLWHREILSALRAISDLPPNKSRSDEQVRAIQKQILDELVVKREDLANLMLSKNSRKPWCQYIDFSKDSNSTSAYNRLSKQINTISERLEIPAPVVAAETSSGAKWEEYLDQNPGMRLWAEANATAAAQLKECPAS